MPTVCRRTTDRIKHIVNVYSVEGLDSEWMVAERGTQRGKVPITYLELL